jgi:hypothetical protein
MGFWCRPRSLRERSPWLRRGYRSRREGDEGVGVGLHHGLPGADVAGDDLLAVGLVGDAEVDHLLGDDAGYGSASGGGGAGDDGHEADGGAAVNEAVSLAADEGAERLGCFDLRWGCIVAGTAENADRLLSPAIDAAHGVGTSRVGSLANPSRGCVCLRQRESPRLPSASHLEKRLGQTLRFGKEKIRVCLHFSIQLVPNGLEGVFLSEHLLPGN